MLKLGTIFCAIILGGCAAGGPAQVQAVFGNQNNAIGATTADVQQAQRAAAMLKAYVSDSGNPVLQVLEDELSAALQSNSATEKWGNSIAADYNRVVTDDDAQVSRVKTLESHWLSPKMWLLWTATKLWIALYFAVLILTGALADLLSVTNTPWLSTIGDICAVVFKILWTILKAVFSVLGAIDAFVGGILTKISATSQPDATTTTTATTSKAAA